MRREILKDVNKIIKEEHGKELKEDNLLSDSSMDSFAYAIFWLEIGEKYRVINGGSKALNKYVDDIDYKTYTIKNLIDQIEYTTTLKDKIQKVKRYKNCSAKYKKDLLCL